MTADKPKDDSSEDFASRPMIKGSWKCADCGAEITELPFEPAADRPVHCRDCWAKKRDQRRDSGPRKMFQGNWKCVDCGAKITELPFQPKEDTDVRCRDCWMKQKEQK